MGNIFPKKTPGFIPLKPIGWEDGYFKNQFGSHLRYGHAPALGDSPSKGTVILTHGYGEFIDLYAEAIGEYQKMGFDVWAMDFYGFGKSGRDNPAKPHTPSALGLARHVDDLHEFITRIVQPDRSKPVLMSTHSMGGHIGLRYLQAHPAIFDGAIMSAPMFDVYRLGLPKSFKPLIHGLFNLASKIGLRDVSIPDLSRWLGHKNKNTQNQPTENKNEDLRVVFNRAVRQTMPEASISRPTFGWLSSAFNSVAKATTDNALRHVTTPVLIGSAGHETLVDNDALKKAAALMPRAQLVQLNDAQHGMWFENENNYSSWLSHVKSFVGQVNEQFYTTKSPQFAAAQLFTAKLPPPPSKPTHLNSQIPAI